MAAERRADHDRRVLLLAPTARDGEATRAVLAAAGIPCEVCPVLYDLCARSVEGASAVILPEEAVLSDESDGLARRLREQPVWSDLPVIVLTRAGLESSAVERATATLGNVSLIERPMRVSTLLSVVRAAVRARERQYQLRDHLDEVARAEASLRESEARFRLIADTLPHMVWITRPDGYHEFYNRRWYEFTGVPDGSTDGEGWNNLFHPDDQGRAWERWRHSLATGEPYEIEYRLRHHGGEYRWTLGRAVAVRGESGEIERWLGTCTDIDTMKRLTAEREQLLHRERAARNEAVTANRAKDKFLAVLSHELRTPLTPVAMAATAMELDPRLPSDLRDDVSMIRRNIDLETRLIDDLLDLSRVISGKFQISPQPTDVHRLIRHVLEMLGPELHEKRLTVEQHLLASDDRVQGDPARLQQTLWNLLKNAAKFSDAGGKVVIRTRDEADSVIVEVADSGKGIAQDVLQRIFDPFEQGEADVTRHFGGLGLGLAIAKAVVDLHGGTITGASAGPGKGSVFTVSLPLAGDSARDTGGSGGDRPAEGAARPVRLLLVEDHVDTAQMLMKLLRLDGSEVRWASSVAGALRLAEAEGPFDVAVSDLGLPDGSGHDLMRQLRQRYPGVPGIAMSGYGMEEDLRLSADAGFTEHLVKPVSVPQLRAAIRRAAAERREDPRPTNRPTVPR